MKVESIGDGEGREAESKGEGEREGGLKEGED